MFNGKFSTFNDSLVPCQNIIGFKPVSRLWHLRANRKCVKWLRNVSQSMISILEISLFEQKRIYFKGGGVKNMFQELHSYPKCNHLVWKCANIHKIWFPSDTPSRFFPLCKYLNMVLRIFLRNFFLSFLIYRHIFLYLSLFLFLFLFLFLSLSLFLFPSLFLSFSFLNKSRLITQSSLIQKI